MPNYSEKTLHVALTLNKGKNRDRDRGLVYLPQAVYANIHPSSERIYQGFFKREGEFRLVPIVTRQGPGEFGITLEKKFGVNVSISIGGVIASFDATPTQARTIIEELRDNPRKYYHSKEEAKVRSLIFGI